MRGTRNWFINERTSDRSIKKGMHIQFVNERECVNSPPKRGLKVSLPRGYTISILRKRHR